MPTRPEDVVSYFLAGRLEPEALRVIVELVAEIEARKKQKRQIGFIKEEK